MADNNNSNQSGNQGAQSGNQGSQSGQQSGQGSGQTIITDRGANANSSSERKSLTEKFNEQKKK